MKVRAKFRITGITLYESPEGSGQVTLTAGNDKEGDNTDWSKWTPSGQITMTITNPDAFKQFIDAFHKKQRVYVDFNALPETLTEGSQHSARG
jgi:hypothetical protein